METVLGVVTNTQDSTGEILERRPVGADRAALASVLPAFTGALMQVPPMYSAVKVRGKKLYELARKGQEVERKPRPVTIYSLELLEDPTQPEDGYLLRVACSKGTYVRTLCHDIGQALGCGACMSALRRTRAAGFGLEEAVTLDGVLSAADPARFLRPVDEFFARGGWTARTGVPPAAEKLLRNGGTACVPGPDGELRVYGAAGEFLGLGSRRDGRLRLIKSFFEV